MVGKTQGGPYRVSVGWDRGRYASHVTSELVGVGRVVTLQEDLDIHHVVVTNFGKECDALRWATGLGTCLTTVKVIQEEEELKAWKGGEVSRPDQL